MAETKISDVVVPEIFLPYVIEKTSEKSLLIQAGIVQPDPEFDRLASAGGNLVQMPFWQDLQGDDEVLSDGGALTVNKITSSKDVARKHQRGKAWGANDLARLLSGDDPIGAIASLVADFRARKMQAQLLNTLNGIFGAASMSGNLLAIHQTGGAADATHMLNGVTFIDATQLMGDQKDKLTAVMMHSAVESHLKKLDLIDFIPDSEGGDPISVFQGKRVIVDDGLTPTTIDSKPVYPTYLFGQGALALGMSNEDTPIEGGFGTWQLEYGRNGLAGETWLANRWRHILHPRGIAWQEASVAGDSPTNAEIATQSNWIRVFEQQNVRVVKVTHNITL
jgi:hypothetical protein